MVYSSWKNANKKLSIFNMKNKSFKDFPLLHNIYNNLKLHHDTIKITKLTKRKFIKMYNVRREKKKKSNWEHLFPHLINIGILRLPIKRCRIFPLIFFSMYFFRIWNVKKNILVYLFSKISQDKCVRGMKRNGILWGRTSTETKKKEKL